MNCYSVFALYLKLNITMNKMIIYLETKSKKNQNRKGNEKKNILIE